uniref:Arf-GAP domain-containing protein n=1 Tax=Parastrongyloides trichosuri TaxID=131310 RepID=A0A0N5A3F5_PARTI
MSTLLNHTTLSSWKCADCDAEKPTWASINLAVLLCSDCASIHRDLGRHISQLVSLQKSYWSPYRLELILYLYSNGSNNIWEYFLSESSRTDQSNINIRHFVKPKPESAITPTKEKYIRDKYSEKKFASKTTNESQNDLDMQLFACVRTSHVETTLRLLIHGANPNYVNCETGETPLHVATREGQLKQVELLCIYGANLFFENNKEETPKRISKENGNMELLSRLLELEFEISDKISWFLCGKMPSHDKNCHFLIPDIVGSHLTEKQKRVLMKYTNQNNESFASISQDIFDEVERRINEKIWYAEIKERHEKLGSIVNVMASFLPLNPIIPSFRNQRRQKLAKFDTNAFVYLLVCHLKETKRRFNGENKENILRGNVEKETRQSQKSSEKHFSSNDYDECASVPSPDLLAKLNEKKLSYTLPKIPQNNNDLQVPLTKEVEILQDIIKKQTQTINNLSDLVVTLSREVKIMQDKVEHVVEDNTTLQDDLSRLRAHVYMKDTQFANQTNAFIPKNASFQSNNSHSSNVPNISNNTPLSNANFPIQRNSTMAQNSNNTYKGHVSPENNEINYIRNVEYNEKIVTSHNIQAQKDNSYINILSEQRAQSRNEKSRSKKDGFTKGKIVRFVDDLTSAIRSLQTELLKSTPYVYPHCEAVNAVVFNILDSVPKSLQRKTVLLLMQKLENSMYRLESICSNPNINVHEASLAAFALALAAKNLFITCE